jgi:hypothetical protein
VVTDRGGGLIEIPDASTCYPADDTYTLTLPALELTWKVCGSQDGGAYAYVTGSKTLSATEFAPLSTALHALAISTKIQCGADKSSEQVAFTTSSGDAVYLDDFYHCSDDGKAYVSGMDAVLTELGKLAR